MSRLSPSSRPQMSPETKAGSTGECQAIMYLLVSNLFDFNMCTSGNHYCSAKCHGFSLTLISKSTTSYYFISSPFHRKQLTDATEVITKEISGFKLEAVIYKDLIMVIK